MKAEGAKTPETTKEVSPHGAERHKGCRSAPFAREKRSTDWNKNLQICGAGTKIRKRPMCSWERIQMGNVNLILIFTAPSGFFRSMLRQRIFGVRFWLNMLSVGAVAVAWTGSARAAAAVYPVKVSANNRYLVDQNNAPFLIMGDCPQSLTVNLSVAQTDSYFSNRQAHGFNTMWINLVCTVYTAGRRTAAPSTGCFHSRDTSRTATICRISTSPNPMSLFSPVAIR